MTPGRQSVIEQLRKLLAAKTLILGIGNTMREDDGVGPYFASLCEPREDLLAFDCGEAPEKYIGKAISEKPDTVLLADAADFGGEPGEIRLLDMDEIRTRGISTHDISLKILVDYLLREGRPKIVFLAFQPCATRLGRELSEDLKLSARRVARELALAPPNCGGGPYEREENNTDR